MVYACPAESDPRDKLEDYVKDPEYKTIAGLRTEGLQGLIDLVNAAGATLEGIGVAVEKGFQGGGDKFRASGVPYKALAVIEQADENGILFREDD